MFVFFFFWGGGGGGGKSSVLWLEPNTLKFFVEKMKEAFAVQKLLPFFQ